MFSIREDNPVHFPLLSFELKPIYHTDKFCCLGQRPGEHNPEGQFQQPGGLYRDISQA